MRKKNSRTPLPNLTGALIEGSAAAWPICLGYVPIGLAFGVLAQKAGLRPFEIGLMSVLVFAGSSQFIGISMLAAGVAPGAIILTTFMVNLRHMLMSSALAVFMGDAARRWLALFAYGVTDESFAINFVRFKEGHWDLTRALALNHTANLTWLLSTVAGGYGGHFVPPGALGIDYALVAMFICLLVFQLRGRVYALTGILSGILAVGLALLLPGNAYIILASALGAGVGVFLKKGRKTT